MTNTISTHNNIKETSATIIMQLVYNVWHVPYGCEKASERKRK